MPPMSGDLLAAEEVVADWPLLSQLTLLSCIRKELATSQPVGKGRHSLGVIQPGWARSLAPELAKSCKQP